jgi:hypothetical protein
LTNGQINCQTVNVQSYTITFSPTFASVPKFGMGLTNIQRETQVETQWSVKIEIFSISTSSAVIKTYCYNSEWMNSAWV